MGAAVLINGGSHRFLYSGKFKSSLICASCLYVPKVIRQNAEKHDVY